MPLRRLVILSALAATAAAAPRDLATTAERTAYRETGTYDEVTRLCHDFAASAPKAVRCEKFGETPEHRPMWVLSASTVGALTPAAARAKKRPVVMLVAGTHAGEIDGKDAGFQVLRELLAGGELLQQVVVVFVPVFNVDGHENRGRHYRPNQNGPLEQGSRTTSQRINLNRDYMIADAPEMQALLRLLNAWDPLLLVDLHTTDGAKFQHDVAITMGPAQYGDPALAAEADALQHEVLHVLEVGGHKPLGFYPRLYDVGDPGQGFVLDVDSPRHSHAYWGLRNRLAALVEDHSWKDYASRVKTAHDSILAFLQAISRRAPRLAAATAEADRAGARWGDRTVNLAWDTITDGDDVHRRPIEFLGYEYDVLQPAPIVGGRGLVYRDDRPTTWKVPFFDDVRPVPGATVRLPRGGYLVPAAYAVEVENRLKIHGLSYRVLARGLPARTVEAQRVDGDDVEYEASSYQNRQLVQIQAQWAPEEIALPPGSLFVPIAQPRGLLVAHLFEPQAPDSLSTWGVFNAAYEQSDWMTGYRALELARWMHDGDAHIRELYGDALFARLPALKAAFTLRVAKDAEFASDPSARLDFWMREIPPQDGQLNRYPVFRVEDVP